MQGCFKGLRAPLIGHVGHDIDIENSLPVITGQWLQGMIDRKEVELSVEHIQDYAHNRKKWLDEIMEYHNCTAEQAKRLVLIAMHGGNPNHAKISRRCLSIPKAPIHGSNNCARNLNKPDT